MAYLQLLPHVRFTLVDQQPIFLDLKRDRYLALDPSTASLFDHVRAKAGKLPADTVKSTKLLSTELFAIANEPQACTAPSVPVPTSGQQAAKGVPSVSELAEVTMRVAQARIALAQLPIERVLARRGARNSALGPASDHSDIAHLGGRFLRARSLVPMGPRCLPDSLALTDWLHARRAAASIVFGVKLHPFAAHCWVQTEQAVLNDAPDRVLGFTPIHVVK